MCYEQPPCSDSCGRLLDWLHPPCSFVEGAVAMLTEVAAPQASQAHGAAAGSAEHSPFVYRAESTLESQALASPRSWCCLRAPSLVERLPSWNFSPSQHEGAWSLHSGPS